MIFISKNLELLRKKSGLKQSELAEKLGVKANTISNYEKGVSQPDYTIINKLMNLFDVTSDQLLFSDLSSEDISRNLKKEDITESIFDKFLAKIDERDRKLDEKDSKIDHLQLELRQKSEELAAFKAKYPQSQAQEPDSHPMVDKVAEAFTSESLRDYGEDSLPTKHPTGSKRSSAGKA